jgi:hypothetical protein
MTSLSEGNKVELLHGIFVCSFSTELIPTLITFGDDPIAVWDGLQLQFQSQVEQKKTDLQHELNTLTMKAGETTESFLIALNNLVVKLGAVGIETTNTKLVNGGAQGTF